MKNGTQRSLHGKALRGLSVLCFGAVLTWAWRAAPPALSRGPYLQSTSDTGVTVVFQTSSAATSAVRYGTKLGPPWEFERTAPSGTTHVIQLSGLQPDTKYFYEVASGGAVIARGKDHFFRTSPPTNSRAPFRFVAWGDSGIGSSTQYDVAARTKEVVPEPEFALGLGDLVYDSGSASDYDPNLIKPYAEIFPRMTFWPTLGNHDVKTSSGQPYLDAFYLPTKSGAPGHPSNTERYYSFDHGMAHFVCADSETSSASPGSAMYDWISDDLDDARARGKRWLFVYFHKPPYSRGTHDDEANTRDNLVPLFEAKGVDMVMCGHSHVYERSYLVKNNAVIQNGHNDYSKITSPNGTIYMVSGCGGKTGSGSLDHKLMATSYGDVAGFSLIDVGYEEVRGYFVERDGQTTDIFTLRKAADRTPPRVTAVRATGASEIQLSFDEPVKATGATGAANPANYQLFGGAVLGATLDSDQHTVTLRTTTLTPNRAGLLFVQDVADSLGNVDLTDDQEVYFTLEAQPGGGGGGGGGGIPKGSTWRYFKGTAAPPTAWKTIAFNDSAWAQGQAGFGYEDGDDATVLSDMKGSYATVFVRKSFSVSNPAQVTGLRLNASYDDGFVAFLNGVEVARANVPAGQTNTTLATTGHEAGSFEPFDLGAFKSALVSGTNLLALEGHNGLIDSNDFSLHAELVVSLSSGGGGSGGLPLPVFDCDIETANAPARITFSGARSVDPEGALRLFVWDFGDGTRALGSSAQHVYNRDGIYDATLIVRDGQRLDAVDRRTIRIHSIGNGPVVRLGANSTRVGVGGKVDFNAGGSNDPDGGKIYIHWDFGDPASGESNQSILQAASHVFARAGVFTVRLSITDDEGSTSTQTVVITVG